jgi:hypothetical protein
MSNILSGTDNSTSSEILHVINDDLSLGEDPLSSANDDYSSDEDYSEWDEVISLSKDKDHEYSVGGSDEKQEGSRSIYSALLDELAASAHTTTVEDCNLAATKAEQPCQKEQQTTTTTKPAPREQKTFGKTQTGDYCKRCINKKGYCRQHESQNPAPLNEREQCPAHTHHYFGINKTNGKPCKLCIKQGGYCHHHTDQDPQYNSFSSQPSSSSSSTKPQYVPFGRCKDGQSCKLCEKKGGFCHHHKDQVV